MKRLVSGFLAAAALVALAGPAVAQTGAEGRSGDRDRDARVKFYKFEDFDVFGARRAPALTAFDGRQRVRFERLARLKKTFVPALVESGKGPGYR